MTRILIFANGHLPDLDAARALLRPDDFIIAADGGTHHALALGLIPNILIGDLDSLTFDLRPLTEQGTQVIQFSRDKNETDLELAIQHAVDMKPDQIIVVGALGGRLDQTLGNLALLSDLRLLTFDLRLDDGVEETFFCRNQAQVQGQSGDIVSLIPWGAPVEGVRTEGLRWPLSDETLYPYKTRGISNELLGERAVVRIRSGLLLIVHRRASQER
ncbi:MAG: thiamine diphosphokinase [Chloroflexi bacterium]|nr:thiamine diphosphokinase [Chloroflexota bacterium]